MELTRNCVRKCVTSISAETPFPSQPHEKYSSRFTVKSTGAGRSRDTTLLRLRRGRFPAVGPRLPFAGMFGKAGAKESQRVKPQRSRRVRGVLDADADGRIDADDSNIGVWISDIGFWTSR
jgi:hypothetical protein